MVAREQVLHVARLARLELAGDELERLAVQLAAILEYVDQLRELDSADGGGPSPPISLRAARRAKALRPDSPGETLPRETLLALFPVSDGEHVLVPPVLPPRHDS
jgi:aspartyl-tRNA(Asn)/glutamyl-tRNA(Gln) amidotransferase subunit C